MSFNVLDEPRPIAFTSPDQSYPEYSAVIEISSNNQTLTERPRKPVGIGTQRALVCLLTGIRLSQPDHRRAAMSTLKTLFARIASRKHLLVICLIAAFATVSLIRHQPNKIISSAKAVETRSPVVAPMDARQISWSDEWYESHKAIPDGASENIEAF